MSFWNRPLTLWADDLTPDRLPHHIRTFPLTEKARQVGVEVWGVVRDAKGRPLLQILAAGFREDRPGYGELVMLYPVELAISFPVAYPDELERIVGRQQKAGLASLKALQGEVAAALVRWLQELAICPLLFHVWRAFPELKLPTLDLEAARQPLPFNQRRPLLRLRPVHFDATGLRPENQTPSTPDDEKLPMVPDGHQLQEALMAAYNVVVLLRYWRRIGQAIHTAAFGHHQTLAEPMRGRPPLTTEDLRQTLELAIEALQDDPSLSVRKLHEQVAFRIRQRHVFPIDAEGVRYRLNEAFRRTGIQRSKGRYRLEELKATLERLRQT